MGCARRRQAVARRVAGSRSLGENHLAERGRHLAKLRARAEDMCEVTVRRLALAGYVSCSRHIAGGRRLVTEDPATGPRGAEPGPGQPSWPTGPETVDDRDGTPEAPGPIEADTLHVRVSRTGEQASPD